MSRGAHRYGAVLVLTVAMTTFALAVPDRPIMRAIELAWAGLTLGVAMLTSGAQTDVRRAAAIAVGIALVVVAGAAAAGAPSEVATFTATAIANAATIAIIVGGLIRLVEDRGVVVQAVFGALAVYLLIGLTFGFVIGALATGVPGAYFAQGTDGVQSQRVYFSFTVMTTSGFGDLTARTPPGRAFSVLEMLVGQLYLVTVIATIVGNLRSRRAPGHRAGDPR
jgi:hypothetical protein